MRGVSHGVWLLGLVWMLLATVGVAAPIDSFTFDNQRDEDRFKRLIEEIRCVKCQNTSIAGSNADLARDHRTKVYDMLKQGKSDDDIRQWFLTRYGDFVLYRPQVDSRTWLLWALPLVLLPVGLFMLVSQLRRRGEEEKSEGADRGESTREALTAEERQRLEEVLKDG